MRLRSAIAVLALVAVAPLALHGADYRIQVKGADVPNHIMFLHLALNLESDSTPEHPEPLMLLTMARKLGIDEGEAQTLASQIIEAADQRKLDVQNATRRLLCSVPDYPAGDKVFDAMTALQDAEVNASVTVYEAFLTTLTSSQSSKLSAWLEDMKQGAAYRLVDHRTKWADSAEAHAHVVRVCNKAGMDFGGAQ